LGGLTSQQVETIVSEIVSKSGTPIRSPTLIPVDGVKVPTASTLDEMIQAVCAGRAANGSLLLVDLTHDGVKFPEIVVYVWRESVTLEYRQGSAWTHGIVAALFSLLRTLHTIAPQARLECECEVPEPAAFLAGWTYYLRFHPVDSK